MRSPEGTHENPLTSRQRSKIWAAAREIGLGDEALHQELDRVTGKSSIRTLTKAEAGLFIDFMVNELGASGPGRNFIPSRPSAGPAQEAKPVPRATVDNVVRLATRGQLEKIQYLLRDLGLTRDSARFLGIAARATGRSRIRTTLDASRVIDALREVAGRPQGHAGSGQVEGEPPKGA